MSNSDEFLWSEMYRPKTVDECVLPAEIKSTFLQYLNKKEVPNLLLVGGPGHGKTTLAKALCNEVGCDYLFLNGSSENGIDTFRNKITNFATSVSLNGGKKVIIIDEADYLTQQCFAALRGIEAFTDNCTFILTGNYKNKFPEAILSRFTSFDFSASKAEKKSLIVQFFKRVCHILTKEGIEFDKEPVAMFMSKHYPDGRKILNELQRYAVSGKIDSGILTQHGNLQMKDLIRAMRGKDYTSVQTWIVENLNNDADRFYRAVYDALSEHLKPHSIPQVVLIIAKYQYQNGFVADPEIQALAMCIEIMVDGEFI